MLHQSPSPTALHQPRFAYFISRSNGVLVPLIPADELPFSVRLQGVPRVLTYDQTYSLQQVGVAPYTGLTFKLEDDTVMHEVTSQPSIHHNRNPSSDRSKQFLAPDALARQALANSSSGNGGWHSSRSSRSVSARELAANWRSQAPLAGPIDRTQATIDAIIGPDRAAEGGTRPSKGVPTPPPSGNVPDQDKKEYCTYWIRTGECDYAQQGCLYKHEMPDKATLTKIGFRGTPRWWLEKTQVVKPSVLKPTAGPSSTTSAWLKMNFGNGQDAGEESNKDSESERDSVKSSKSTKIKVQREKVNDSDQKSADSGSDQAKSSIPQKTATSEEDPEANEAEQDKRSHSRVDARQNSTSSDLIDFSLLLPTPTSSTSSLADAPAHIVSKPNKTPNTEKVFVPRGESPETHIAEAKKRAARKESKTARGLISNAAPLDKQIQSLQKGKGLMASKHAPFRAAGTGEASRSSVKNACQVRRPATITTMPVPTSTGKKTLAE